MKIGAKLLLSFGAVVVAGAIGGGVGFWGLVKTASIVQEVGGESLPAVREALTLEDRAAAIKAAQRTLIDITVSAADRAKLYSEIEDAEARFDHAWEMYASLPNTPRTGELWKKLSDVRDRWRRDNETFAERAKALDAAAAKFNATPRAAQTNYVAGMREASNISYQTISEFKTQVQEWKNILLRGKDPAQFDRYLAAFNGQERAVDARLTELGALMRDLGLDATLVDAARAAHQAAGKRYEEALRSYDRAHEDPASVVDGLVAGVDRSIADAIAKVTDAVGAGLERTEDILADLRHQSLVVCNASTDEMEDVLSELVEARTEEADAAIAAARTLANTVKLTAIVAIILSAAVGFGLGLRISRKIRGAITGVLNALQAIADGDLTRPALGMTVKDEIGDLARATDAMGASLRGIVSDITASANGVASAATEIAASNEEMSAGLAEQADQVTQVSSATEEMSATSQEVAGKSTDGRRVVEETISRIEEIAGEVKASATAVNTLGQKSEEIGQIIAVINDIADQTNLLALNAAIEAARAGEHGRGFAVVADEVRKLAERTTQATEQVGTSIREIQTETEDAVRRMEAGTQKVEGGVQYARQAGDALGSIVAAAEQQSAATIEISQSIEQINSVAMQSREGAQQAAAAATQLSAEAEKLQTLVGRFKV